MTMDKPVNKSNESTISTTGTTGTPPFSDTIDNNVKYINLNFVDNSESSSQAKDAQLEFPKIQNPCCEAPKAGNANKPPRSKILPSNLPFPGGKIDSQKQKHEPSLKEKSLTEMGFKSNEISGWENIVQPPKESLYKLLKNMIDNHIKPNVQIRIGGVTFNCHMMVLQCYSDFFMECSNEVLIQLPEEKITPGAFMMVYDWMLAEEPLVQREGILELFNAANFLRIKNLVNQCWLCLDDDVRFREDTAFLLYLEARNYGLESLEQLMLMRICKFFLTLVSSREFLQLTSREICTLLSSNTIGVNSEIEIFMSVVRWLTHNYEERERDMLNVVKCVRFSLMPPWFLVTLNKNTDCTEIDRIVGHPEVKKMINDGISYTTTQLYYGENREEFLHFLERYQLMAPTQRQWVFDKECSYHHRLECPNMQYVTYKSFLEYLEMIHTIGKDYWKTLEMAKGVEKTMQCCVRSDCRKTTEQNLATVYTKKCRDQGVQVEDNCITKLRKDFVKATDLREFINVDCQTITTNNKSSKIRAKKSFQPVAATEILSCCHPRENEVEERYHQYLKAQQQRQHQHQHHQKRTFDNKKFSGPKEAGHIRHQTTMGANQQQLNKLNKMYINCGNHTENKFTGATTQDHDSNILKVDTQATKFRNRNTKKSPVRSAKATANVTPETMNTDCNHADESEETKVPVRYSVTSTTALDFNLVTTKKILVFGGVDPYCRHCYLDEAHSPQCHKHHGKQLQHQRRRALFVGTDDDDEEIMADANSEFENYGDQVLFYDAFDNLWKHLSYIPFGSRHNHAAVVCQGRIYIIGGTRTALGCTKKSVFEKSIWSFDPRLLKWTLESTIPQSRRDFAVVAIDDTNEDSKERLKLGTGFFIIGGEGINGAALDSVWFYDVLLRSWSKKASLNLGRYGLAAVLINNEIWIAGGIIDEKSKYRHLGGGDAFDNNDSVISTAELITDTMEYLSLRTTQDNDEDGKSENEPKWIMSKIRLRIPRLFGKFCKIGQNQIYLVGGIGVTANNLFTSLSSIDRFDMQEEKWSHCGDVHFARHGHDVAQFYNKIIIIGGVSTQEKRALTKVETFCTKTHDIIKEVDDMPWPLSGCAVVTL